jgi:uncharacterized protein
VTFWELLAIALAGVGAGFINSVAGSGTLITFPTLIALGVPPVTANVSNNVGLVPGAASAAWGWRHELVGQHRRLVRLAAAGVVGGLTGAVLLLVLPEQSFAAIVPVLVLLGVVLVAVQPWINRRLVERAGTAGPRRDAWWLWPAVGLTSVYGGYFGAAQGILLMAVLGTATSDSLKRDNAFKNVIAGIVNATAAVVFVLVADVDWRIAAMIAVGSVLGAQLGALVGRRMPDLLLRAAIVLVGTGALAVFLLR